jgi:hypothetical protein
MQTRKLGNSDLHITPVGVAHGPSAIRAGSSHGDLRTTMIPSEPFIARANSGSTGSTRPQSTAWGTRRQSLDERSRAGPIRNPTSSPSADGAGTPGQCRNRAER